MITKKSLKELEWDVSEKEYRDSPYISQSILAAYDRQGCLTKDMMTPKHTDYFLLGTLVDKMLQDVDLSEEYLVIDREPPQKVKEAIHILRRCDSDIDTQMIINVLNQVEYRNNLSDKVRVEKFRKEIGDYIDCMNENKIPVPKSTMDMAADMTYRMRNSPYTERCFPVPGENIEVLDQFKIKDMWFGIFVKGMLDRVIVNHKEKSVTIIDFKTTSRSVTYFEDSYVEYRYYLQSRMYVRLMDHLLGKDEYFQKFHKIAFYFAVVDTLGHPALLFKDNYAISHRRLDDKITVQGKTCKGLDTLIQDLAALRARNIYEVPYESAINGIITLDCVKSIV